jgi:hypothetical protein
LEQEEMLTFGVLGEQGGPGWARNLKLQQYAIAHQLGWASTAASNLSDSLTQGGWQASIANAIPGMSAEGLSGAAGTLSGLASAAQNTPLDSLLAYKAFGAVAGGIAGVGDAAIGMYNTGTQLQSQGNQLGYGGGGQYFLGLQNPLSLLFGAGGGATEQGAAIQYANLAAQGLIPGAGGGSGISTQQASQATEELAGQGFSASTKLNTGAVIDVTANSLLKNTVGDIPIVGNLLTNLGTSIVSGIASIFSGPSKSTGDLNTIMQGFMEPMLRSSPGLSATDAAGWTPALRQASTSTDQLTDSLSNLNQAALATKETVNQWSSDALQYAQTLEGMGGTLGEGAAAASVFTAATGLDPSVAQAAVQNPLVQGLFMSQQGILPSGISADPTAVAPTLESAAQMLQKAFSGLNRNRYETVNGQRVLAVRGSSLEAAQIAETLGIPQAEVNRLLGSQPLENRANALETKLGTSATSTGFWQDINNLGKHPSKAQLGQAQNYWEGIAGKNNSSLKSMGLTSKQIAALNATGDSSRQDLANRANMLNQDITHRMGDTPYNKVSSTPTNISVKVGFTGAAAAWFQQVGNGVSTAKAASNAGGPMLAGVVNTPVGDVSPLLSPKAQRSMNTNIRAAEGKI